MTTVTNKYEENKSIQNVGRLRYQTKTEALSTN